MGDLIVDPEFIQLQVESISPLNIAQMRKDLGPLLHEYNEEDAEKIAGMTLVIAHAGIAAQKAHPGDEAVVFWNNGLLDLITGCLPLLQADNLGHVLNGYHKYIQANYPIIAEKAPEDPILVAGKYGAYYARKLVGLNTTPAEK